MKFTEEQQSVIDSRNQNLLVAAAAGSGKTAVLVERVVTMVCDPESDYDIDKFLIVTFTKAAAAEMRERIHNRIEEVLAEKPDCEKVQRQYTLVHRAQITTIDSFCMQVLRNHFEEIDLDPSFRPMDDGEKKLLEEDVLSDFIEEQYVRKDPAFLAAVDFFGAGKGDSGLTEAIVRLNGFAENDAWPEEFLKEHRRDYHLTGSELLEGEIGSFLFGHIKNMAAGLYAYCDRLEEIVNMPAGPAPYGPMVESDREVIGRILDSANFDELTQAFDNVSWKTLASIRKTDEGYDAVLQEDFKAIRKKLKDQVTALRDSFFDVPIQAQAEGSHFSGEYMDTLTDLVLGYRARLFEEKMKRRIVDFSDMEHLALRVLVKEIAEDGRLIPSDTAKEYRKAFMQIMIDEYQDSNYIQEAILGVISGEDEGRPNRFMVGDIKQSIYRFRQARPDLFLSKKKSYGVGAEHENRLIALDRNFRSRSTVIDSVNSVFERIMLERNGEIEYDESESLKAKAAYLDTAGCESELILVDKTAAETVRSVTGLIRRKEDVEALAIAKRILELTDAANPHLVQDTDPLSKETFLRPIRLSDIVILHRSAGTAGTGYKAVFDEIGIPLSITANKGYYSAFEVQEVLNFLRCISNPRSDVALYATMHSVFGQFTEDEIAVIRSSTNKKKSLYSSLCDYRDGNENELADKVCTFLTQLGTIRKLAGILPIRALLQYVFDRYNYIEYTSALPMGSQRIANIEMLLTTASDFEKSSYCGLHQFVRYINKLQNFEIGGEADSPDEGTDVVRMMTIHKSKGLEFPVVFVAGMTHGFNTMDENKNLVFDVKLGLGVGYTNVENHFKSKTLRQKVVRHRMRLESHAEELRVLYVALTRAREKLILVGQKEDAAALAEEIQTKRKLLQAHGGRYKGIPNELSYMEFYGAKCFLDFMEPVLPHMLFEIETLEGIDLLLTQDRQTIENSVKKAKAEHASEYADAGLVSQLRELFEFDYRSEYGVGVPPKVTVTALKELKISEKEEAENGQATPEQLGPHEEESYIPRFCRKDNEPSGTDYGTAFHRMMEVLDYNRILGPCIGAFPESAEEYVKKVAEADLTAAATAFIDEECCDGRLNRSVTKLIRVDRIVTFLSQPIAYRMWRAQRANTLFCEQPFVYLVPASEAFGPDTGGMDTTGIDTMLQGKIDVFFEEEDGYVILDYKTDKKEENELREYYKVQLDWYQRALENLTGKPVKSRLLYSSNLGKCIEV